MAGANANSGTSGTATTGTSTGANDAAATGDGASTTTDSQTVTEMTLGAPAPENKDEKGKPAVDGKKPEGDAASKPLEMKLPDGFKKDDPVVGAFAKDAAEAGLDAEKASKLFDTYVAKGRDSFREAISGELVDGIEAQVKEWEGALKTDKEFGGAKFVENFEMAKQGLEKTASPALKQFLYETGLGSHPEFVRLFYRLGLERAEDTSSGTGAEGVKTARNDTETLLRTLYPTMNQG